MRQTVKVTMRRRRGRSMRGAAGQWKGRFSGKSMRKTQRARVARSEGYHSHLGRTCCREPDSSWGTFFLGAVFRIRRCLVGCAWLQCAIVPLLSLDLSTQMIGKN